MSTEAAAPELARLPPRNDSDMSTEAARGGARNRAGWLPRTHASRWGSGLIDKDRLYLLRMGHTHGFGSTEEPLRRTVFGCRERGLPSGPRLDHTTGEGHVPFHKGDYHDALRHKNNQVALLLVECFGGVASGGARLLRYLARRASDKKRGRDGTKYSKFHPRGYLSHHLAAISMAAVYTDAAHIADGVIGLKQRSLAASDPTE